MVPHPSPIMIPKDNHLQFSFLSNLVGIFLHISV